MSEYVFKNVNQIGEKEYQTVIDGQELAEMWRDGIITYNPEIQREQRLRGKRKTKLRLLYTAKPMRKKSILLCCQANISQI